MSDGAQKSDLAVVGTTNPEPLNIVINTFADRIFNGGPHIGLIIRVQGVEVALQWNEAFLGIETMQASGLIRPVMDLPCLQIGRPAADVGQALRFRQVRLFPPQLLSQLVLRCNIFCCAAESLKNSIFNHRNANTANVPYLPVWSNDALRDIAAAALLMQRLYCFGHGGSVLGMDRGQKLLKARRPFLRSKAENLVYLVRPIETQILRQRDAQITGRPTSYMSEALAFA